MKVKFTNEEIKILQQAMEILGMRLNNETPPPVECTEIANLPYVFDGTGSQVEVFIREAHNFNVQPTEVVQRQDAFEFVHRVLYEKLTTTQVSKLENLAEHVLAEKDFL